MTIQIKKISISIAIGLLFGSITYLLISFTLLDFNVANHHYGYRLLYAIIAVIEAVYYYEKKEETANSDDDNIYEITINKTPSNGK